MKAEQNNDPYTFYLGKICENLDEFNMINFRIVILCLVILLANLIFPSHSGIFFLGKAVIHGSASHTKCYSDASKYYSVSRQMLLANRNHRIFFGKKSVSTVDMWSHSKHSVDSRYCSLTGSVYAHSICSVIVILKLASKALSRTMCHIRQGSGYMPNPLQHIVSPVPCMDPCPCL